MDDSYPVRNFDLAAAGVPASTSVGSTTAEVELFDHAPSTASLSAIAVSGLEKSPKTLSPRLLYDARGSELFEAICELPEYYLTRTEVAIMRRHMHEISDALGSRVQLIEPGSGAGLKTCLLLAALEDPVSYVPIDISREELRATASRIRGAFAELQVQAVCADFARSLELPKPSVCPLRRIVFFPGSSIGNFEPDEARRFLGRMARLAGPTGGLLIGYDRRKGVDRMLAAYDDSRGVTAEFNRNVLVRINRDCGGDFPVEQFRHEATWNEEKSRVEIHLVSEGRLDVHLAGRTIHFEPGERLHTESCYKYGPEGVADLADGFVLRGTWTDEDEQFGLQYFSVRCGTV